MGGPVQMGVRTSEGNVYSAELYTSYISPFFDNDRFFTEDPAHVLRYFEEFKENNEYTDHHLLVPNGYGLVFGDHVTKKIHSMQGYTSIGETFTTALTLSATGGVLTSADSEDDFLEHVRMARAHAAGFVPRRRIYNTATEQYALVDLDDTPFEDLVEALVKAMYSNRQTNAARRSLTIPPREDFIVDGGYEIITYQEGYWGSKKFLENLQADGIVFQPEELTAWDAWFKDRQEWLKEDVGDYEFEDITEEIFLEVFGEGYDEPYEQRPPRI